MTVLENRYGGEVGKTSPSRYTKRKVFILPAAGAKMFEVFDLYTRGNVLILLAAGAIFFGLVYRGGEIPPLAARDKNGFYSTLNFAMDVFSLWTDCAKTRSCAMTGPEL